MSERDDLVVEGINVLEVSELTLEVPASHPLAAKRLHDEVNIDAGAFTVVMIVTSIRRDPDLFRITLRRPTDSHPGKDAQR